MDFHPCTVLTLTSNPNPNLSVDSVSVMLLMLTQLQSLPLCTHVHCTVKSFASNSSFLEQREGTPPPPQFPKWWPSSSPSKSPASPGIRTSTGKDKRFGNEGGGVTKANHACTGWHAGAAGLPNESSCAISAMAATFLKNGTCQPCHDHIEIFSHWIFSIYIVTNTNDNLI